VSALAVLLLLADGTSSAPASPSWFTPSGLDAALTIAVFVAAIASRFFSNVTWLKKLGDYFTLAKSYTATVKGIQSFRELATPAEADKLLALIQGEAEKAGVADEHHAAVHAITEGAAPMPQTTPGVVEKLQTSDPVAAVRAATTRLERRVS
jgi:lysozyme family protein